MYEFTLFIVGLMLLGWSSTLRKLLTNADLPNEWNLDFSDDAAQHPSNAQPLTVMIPARNEAENIETSVRSVLASEWNGPIQLIVIDDRSTDDTSAILSRIAAEDDRLTVHLGQEPGEGWLGKPHALHQAQTLATGDIYLFLDADVQLDPQGIMKTWQRMDAQKAVMSSVLGRLETGSFFEHVIQPRLGAILAGGNPLSEVNDPDHERVLANGQFLLFTKDAYEQMGGHFAIRDSVLDDVDFAARAKEMGLAYRLYYGQTVFSCRMYRGLGEIWAGWSKNLFPGLKYSLISTVILTTLMFLWTCLPFLAVPVIYFTDFAWAFPWLQPMLIALVILIMMTDLVGHYVRGYRWHYFWTFPVGMFVICLLFWNSALKIKFGNGTKWKERRVETAHQRQEREKRTRANNKSD